MSIKDISSHDLFDPNRSEEDLIAGANSWFAGEREEAPTAAEWEAWENHTAEFCGALQNGDIVLFRKPAPAKEHTMSIKDITTEIEILKLDRNEHRRRADRHRKDGNTALYNYHSQEAIRYANEYFVKLRELKELEG